VTLLASFVILAKESEVLFVLETTSNVECERDESEPIRSEVSVEEGLHSTIESFFITNNTTEL
jgi:hypothetical protein